MMNSQLYLASTSRYRKQRLEQLGLRFKQLAPSTDESAIAQQMGNANGEALASCLAEAKATSVAAQLKSHPLPANLSPDRSLKKEQAPWIVIGSDQVCHMEDQRFGKPGNYERAFEHLMTFRRQWITFSTGLCLATSDGRVATSVESYQCHFRNLTEKQISDYLKLDQPFDCAGAIKVEQAGLTLIDDTRGRDLNTVFGLPVMLLTEQLQNLGHEIFDFESVVSD
jgi:septum formation protein